MAVLNYDPKTWVAGDLIDDTVLDAEIRDPFTNLQAAWISYTLSVTGATTDPTWGTGGSRTGYYHRWGRTVFGKFHAVAGSSGFSAGAGQYLFSLPVAANVAQAGSATMVGEGFFFDSSTSILYVARCKLIPSVVRTGTPTLALTVNGTNYNVGTFGPVVPAANDIFAGRFMYEAAG